ncbi:hypothetical protein F5X68DRAFT_262796 [Plectosphaerella plurivora]|uniref:DUF7730 domain-containing protein n=1 Tax=Plectosphaerella plurivora TaxID=936078 RepID=A0A9P9A741_9PEZI|nr:hypothetical protein F5X68DRAFT_262796 [Plectosphaerella plurivora]
MAKLKKWFQDHFASPKPTGQSPETTKTKTSSNPPFLPSVRPRPLTPSSVTPQPSTCALFTKLPAHIRHDILIAAFGNRTIHVNLEFSHPRPPPDAKRRHHARIAPLRNEHLLPKSDMAWRWNGSICHRQAPQYAPAGEDACLLFQAVWLDGCMTGTSINTHCDLYGGTWPNKCHIGIVGFLQSCKQAYTEAMDVLYGTNCFHFSGETLLSNLPRFTLPHRLAAISSMEMAVASQLSISDEGTWSHDMAPLKTILDTLAQHAPGLRELRLSLLFNDNNGSRVLEETNTFALLDGFFDVMNRRLETTRVELEFPAFRACPTRQVDEDPLEKKIEKSRAWRNLARYPRPPLQLLSEDNEGREVPSVGYWLVQGDPGRGPDMITCS